MDAKGVKYNLDFSILTHFSDNAEAIFIVQNS